MERFYVLSCTRERTAHRRIILDNASEREAAFERVFRHSLDFE